MEKKHKNFYLIIVTLVIIFFTCLFYNSGKNILMTIRHHFYDYGYYPSKQVIDDVSALPAGIAVPILMYHGVINKGEIESNTSRNEFIEQMEMLKRRGFQTISVAEYDLFREGKFTLPAKPIIITFDDGRKDSFYTVDKVLEKLGFKATMFIATERANNNDPFYLSWDELKSVQETGHWEIEAHGRKSHLHVQTKADGSTGRYLTSRIYNPENGLLESVEDFRERVEKDYIDGINDLKDNLNINSVYFAVPLDNYGFTNDSNYAESFEYNRELTQKYFKLAFIQVSKKDSGAIIETFYNSQNSNPYEIKRLEVKDMTATELEKELDRFAPSEPNFKYNNSDNIEKLLYISHLLYGQFPVNNDATLISNLTSPSARVLFGTWDWKNYSVNITIAKEKGTSASIILYYVDEKNYVSVNWGGKSLFINQYIDGVEYNIDSIYPIPEASEQTIYAGIKDNVLDVSLGSTTLQAKIADNFIGGTAGFSVWDKDGAQSTIKELEIKSLD